MHTHTYLHICDMRSENVSQLTACINCWTHFGFGIRLGIWDSFSLHMSHMCENTQNKYMYIEYVCTKAHAQTNNKYSSTMLTRTCCSLWWFLVSTFFNTDSTSLQHNSILSRLFLCSRQTRLRVCLN